VVAFTRRHGGRTLRVAVAVRGTPAASWGDTVVVFEEERLTAAEVFAEGPVWWSLI
jgi:hypothetical protein